jgi:hypothetical protein
MTVDYTVASLPALTFGAPAPLTREKFVESTGYTAHPQRWNELETVLRNAMAEARGGERKKRPVQECSIYWKNRVLACFQERDVAKREELLDRVWWDAAGELTPLANPLSAGALATYAVRLEIALKRDGISQEKGNAAFDRLTEETKA